MWQIADFDIYESNKIQVDDLNQTTIIGRRSDHAPIKSIIGYAANQKVSLIACVTAVAPIDIAEMPPGNSSAVKVVNALSTRKRIATGEIVNLENIGHTLKFMMVALKEKTSTGVDRLAILKDNDVIAVLHNLSIEDGNKSFIATELIGLFLIAASTGPNRAVVTPVSLIYNIILIFKR